MPTYLSPGVYVEEIESGARPLEGVGTAVAAFVGLAEQGPFNEPTLVSSWTAFADTFGGFVPGSYLARSVYGYFMNGGGNCYVVRIGQNGSDQAKPAKELPAGPHAQVGTPEVHRDRGRSRRARSASRSPTRAATTPARTCSASW